MTDRADAKPLCPGCHFRCQLDAYQCARGAAFFQTWQQTGELPRRERPQGGPGRGHGPAMNLPVEERVLMGLALASREAAARTDGPDAHRVARALARQAEFASPRIVAERSRLPQDRFCVALLHLLEHGHATLEDEPHAGCVVRLTPAGADALAQWDAERAAAVEELLGGLSADQREQLDDLLRALFFGMPR